MTQVESRSEDNPLPLDGVIKFTPKLIVPTPPPFSAEIDYYRNHLKAKGYIGVYPNGIGHGNLTVAQPDGSFIVTATQMQDRDQLDESGYCRILAECEVYEEEVPYEGSEKPSSESRTTIAIIRRRPAIAAVVHVHFKEAQEMATKFGIPEMKVPYQYGTVGFARSSEEMVDQIGADYGIYGTPSHPDGIFCYARTLAEAYQGMVDYCDRVKRAL